MEFLVKLDMWDYLAGLLLLLSIWLLLGGIKSLKKANPDHVDEKKLKIRAYGSFLVAVVYLACRYFS